MRDVSPPGADRYRAAGLWRGETVWAAFAATAARAGARTAVVEGAGRTSFAALAAAAEGLAGGLAARGVRAGDVVAVQLPNWTETLIVLLAAARLGAIANPVLPIYRRRELGFILAESGARVLFIPGRHRDCDHRALVRELRAGLPALEHVVVVRDRPEDGALAYADLATAAPGPPAADAGAIALLTGIVHALLVPAVLGTTAVLMERWDAGDALALVAAERVTYMVGAPTFLRDLAARAPAGATSLRLFSCGGADVDPTLVREAAARLGCVAKRVYGSTEFPTVTTTGPDDPPERRIDSEGRPIGANEIRLVDEDGAPVPTGREGEILARGPECFLGYRDPALNADAFTADGWFRTGDLGTLDAGGWLRITGRRKDIIIRKGENISARELEDLLAAHPAVAEVAVVGVADVAAGEIACAVLRLRPGASAPTLGEVAEHLTARGLSRRKLPERLEVVEDFPRTASGKIVKRALRERLGGG